MGGRTNSGTCGCTYWYYSLKICLKLQETYLEVEDSIAIINELQDTNGALDLSPIHPLAVLIPRPAPLYALGLLLRVHCRRAIEFSV